MAGFLVRPVIFVLADLPGFIALRVYQQADLMERWGILMLKNMYLSFLISKQLKRNLLKSHILFCLALLISCYLAKICLTMNSFYLMESYFKFRFCLG